MRYWFFDGKGPTGPFEEEELKSLPGFNAKSLICPENAQSSNQWKPAQYYLIKPPPQKTRPEAQLPEKTRMGRLADIEEVEAAKKDKENESQKSQAQNPPSRKTGLKILFLSILLSCAIYFSPKLISFFRSQVQSLKLPSLASSDTQDPGSQAIEIVKAFPITPPGRNYPIQITDILLPSKWGTPKTLGVLLEGKALGALSFDTLMFLKVGGLSPISGEKSIAQNPQEWKNWGGAFLEKNLAFQWSSFSLPNSHIRVEASSPAPWSLAGRKDVFDCDVQNKTLKPLNFNAWFDLDPAAARAWAARNRLFWQTFDEPLTEAPAYSLADIAEKSKVNQRKRKKAKAAMPPQLPRQRQEKPKPVSTPVSARPSFPARPVLPASSIPKPAKAVLPKTPENSGSPHKNAANMSLDELNRYLNRSQGQTPSANSPQNPQ